LLPKGRVAWDTLSLLTSDAPFAFKLNQDRRCHVPRQRHKVTNSLGAPLRNADGPDLAAAETQLAKPRWGINRLVESAEFEPRIADLRQWIQGWEAQLKAMRDEAAPHTTPSLVHDQVVEIDWDTRHELIHLLVERTEIGLDDVNIVFRIDPAPPPSNPGSLPDTPTARPITSFPAWRGDRNV